MGRAAGNQAGTSDFLLRRLLRTALLAACLAAALGDGALLGLIAPDQRPHRLVHRPPAQLAPPATAWVSAPLPQAPAHVRAGRGAAPRGAAARPSSWPGWRFCPGRPPVDRFFCELPAAPRTAGADTAADRTLVSGLRAPILAGPLAFVLASYASIPAAMGRLPSAQSRFQALSPCGSHLAALGLFDGTGTALNPLIDSLRNRKVHPAAGSALAGLRG